jgi:hypothetical protein
VRTVNPSLLLLVLVWVALLLPGALRSHLRSSPRTTVGGFQRAMDGLRADRRSNDAHATVPVRVPSAVHPQVGASTPPRRHEDPVLARRRTRFLRLAGLALVALLAAPFVGGTMWVVAGVAWAGVVATAMVLRRLKVQREAARSVLTRLDLRRPAQPLVDEITGELVLAAGSSGSSVRLRTWGG